MNQIDAGTKKRSSWARIPATSAMVFAVAACLLCFPHYLPWMIAFWLIWHTIQVLRLKPGYMPLAAAVGVCVIRFVPVTPWLVMMCGCMCSIAFWRYRTRQRAVSLTRFVIFSTAMLWLLWGLMFWEYRRAANRTRDAVSPLDTSRPIICIGDSLTQGMIPDRGYPGQLESIVKSPVVNNGFSGISTGPAIGIVERSMELNPQVVVLELGGHDFLKWHSRSVAKKNLSRMVEICRGHGAEVVLMEIPRGFIVDPYASLEREIAYEMDVQLVDDRWLRHVVLMSPVAPPGRWLSRSKQLSDDGIHSNEKGSRAIAEFVAESLVRLYGEEILR